MHDQGALNPNTGNAEKHGNQRQMLRRKNNAVDLSS